MEAIKVERYRDNFTAAGYNSLQSVARMSIEYVALQPSGWNNMTHWPLVLLLWRIELVKFITPFYVLLSNTF